MAKGLHSHHHSNSPLSLSPQTSPPVQFPGQCHRGFQSHVLRNRGPVSLERRGEGAGSLATGIPTRDQSTHKLYWWAQPEPRPTDPGPGLGTCAFTPAHTQCGKALGMELTLLLAQGPLNHAEPKTTSPVSNICRHSPRRLAMLTASQLVLRGFILYCKGTAWLWSPCRGAHGPRGQRWNHS